MEQRRNHQSQILVLVATILGAALRIFNITGNSLWLDEGATYYFAKMSFAEIYNSVHLGEFNPPIFYWISHITIRIIPSPELALRLIPAIAGILTIPIIYRIGRELYDDYLGLAAAFLLAISPWHTLYSQEGRAYSLAILFFAIALYFTILQIKNQLNNKHVFYIALFSSLAFWTHFFSSVFIAPMLLILLYYRPRTAILSSILTAIVCSPMIYDLTLLVQARGPYSIIATGAFYTPGVDAIVMTFTNLSGGNMILASIMIVSIAIGSVVIYQKSKQFSVLMIAMSTIPFIILEIAVIKIQINTRYMGYLIIPLTILISAMISFFKTEKTTVYSISVLTLVALLSISATIPNYTTPVKPDWRGTAEFLSATASPGSTIVTFSILEAAPWLPLRAYYNNSSHGTFIESVQNCNEILKLWPNNTYFIIADVDPSFSDTAHNIQNWISNNTVPVFHTYDLTVYKYQHHLHTSSWK